jgi:singapore isolate B (sub-type 7) whole genome shotgun sequence assembly, scaffold_1
MILEFRIPLPITVADFQVAQLAMVIKAQEKVTGGGEGIVVVKNEPYLLLLLRYPLGLITPMATWD